MTKATDFKVGDKVHSNSKKYWYSGYDGVVISVRTEAVGVRFPKYAGHEGHNGEAVPPRARNCWFFSEGVPLSSSGSISLLVPGVVKVAKPKKPHGAQEYKGNGKHTWEKVNKDDNDFFTVVRLRVPGGWLYSEERAVDCEASNMVFVPVPSVVGYKV